MAILDEREENYGGIDSLEGSWKELRGGQEVEKHGLFGALKGELKKTEGGYQG